jgi:hypothetical protein
MKKQTITTDFETGLEHILNAVIETSAERKPFILTVIGSPSSGKSELKTRAIEKLASLEVYGWVGYTDDDYEIIRQRSIPDPDFILIQDVSNPSCSDRYSRQLFRKHPDLRVYIKGTGDEINIDDRTDIALGVYGLVIENSHATNNGKYKGEGK